MSYGSHDINDDSYYDSGSKAERKQPEVKPESWRVSQSNRFWISNKDKTGIVDVVFVDSPEMFTDDERRLLAAFGLGQGRQKYFEHQLQMYNPRTKRVDWNNFFTSPKFNMLPFIRVLYMKVMGAWGKVGTELEKNIDNLDAISEFYMSPEVDPLLYRRIIDPEYFDRVWEIMGVPLGKRIVYKYLDSSNGVVEVDDYVEAAKSSKPKLRWFRTIIDRSSFTSRKTGIEYKDTLKLFVTSGGKSESEWKEQYDCAGSLGRNSKPEVGLGGHLYELSRTKPTNKDDKIPSTGNGRTYVEHLDYEKIYKEVNPEAVFHATHDSIRERLTQDLHFTYHRMVANGYKYSVDDMVDLIADTLKIGEGRYLPRPADYQQILLPMTPSKIYEVFGHGEVMKKSLDTRQPNGFSDDDIPF